MADVTVNTLTTDSAGVAEVKVVLPGVQVTAQGTSKKHPKDVNLRSVGESLALARAMRKAADDLEARAMETVRVWNVSL